MIVSDQSINLLKTILFFVADPSLAIRSLNSSLFIK
jgi:hypothetical protein